MAGNGPSVSLQAGKTYSSPFCKVTVMFSLTVQVSKFWIRSEKNQDILCFCIYIFKITASYDPNSCDIITPADRSTGATVMFSVSSVMLRLFCVGTGPRKEKKMDLDQHDVAVKVQEMGSFRASAPLCVSNPD